jgi:(4S)-4-hydroxy-5-phosphonooxypentane-2,3-dione isomerase
MLVVMVHVRVKTDRIDDFRTASIANAKQSIKEPGIARFDVLQDRDQKDRFLLVEIYRTEQDPARHKETEHYRTWRDAVEPMMAEPRTSVKYANAFPPDQGF